MLAVLNNDAAASKEVVVAEDAPPAEWFRFQPTQTLPSTDKRSWCSTCGRPQTDPMTGLMDRWTWAQRAALLLDRFGRARDPITMLIADLDRFKSINDSVGHMAGDSVLTALAEVIRSETRSGDLWGRYGSYAGDEFVGLLPGADVIGAISVAERLQRQVAAMRISVATPAGIQEISGVSISIGLASHLPGRNLDDTFGRADMALLTAKRSGRHCVCVADAQSHVVTAHRGGRDQGNEWYHRDRAC